MAKPKTAQNPIARGWVDMKRYKRIYEEMKMLFDDVSSKDTFGYSTTFTSKMASFEIMHKETLKKAKHLESVAKEEKAERKIVLSKTTTAWYEAIAFFEAYLNAFYSLLQIIAKFTPYFYGNDKDKIPDDYFGNQVNFFNKNANFDAKFSLYLVTRMGWYKTLKNNRHAVTHRLSAFLGLDENGRVGFLDYPEKEFDWFGQKASKDLEAYLVQSFDSLFDFMEFYTQHFRKKIPESERTKMLRRLLTQKSVEK